MTRLSAKRAQEELPRLLDAVEQGEEVLVERGGRRFRLSLVLAEPDGPTGTSPLVVDDPEVLSGNWSWVAGEDGQLEFRARREGS